GDPAPRRLPALPPPRSYLLGHRPVHAYDTAQVRGRALTLRTRTLVRGTEMAPRSLDVTQLAGFHHGRGQRKGREATTWRPAWDPGASSPGATASTCSSVKAGWARCGAPSTS